MDAVANDLLPLSRAGVETATALGIVSVGGATCDPPEIPIGYRSSLKSSQLAELEQRLLAEPRVAKVTLEPATPGAPTPPNLIPLSSDGLYLRPVLCTIPPTTSGAKVDTGPAVDACSSQHPALIASTTPAGDSAAAQVIVPNFDNSQRYVLGPADLTVKGVASAIAAQDPATGGFQVELSLTNQANQVMNRVAAVRYSYYKQSPPNPPHQSEEAIEVGGVVQSAPPVQSPSFNGTLIISYTSYTMTQADAKRIVQVIDTASKD